MRIYFTKDRFERYDFYGEIPQVGECAVLVSYEHILTGEKWHGFAPEDGAGGNLDPSVKRYHGWRGTTNDVSRHAIGLRRIEKVTQFKNGNYAVDVSKDLAPDKD